MSESSSHLHHHPEEERIKRSSTLFSGLDALLTLLALSTNEHTHNRINLDHSHFQIIKKQTLLASILLANQLKLTATQTTMGNSSNDNEILVFTLAVLVPLTAIFLFCGFLKFKYGWSDGFFNGAAPVVPVIPSTAGVQVQESPAAIERKELMRMRILETMFPESSADNNHAKIFCYDVESKRYTPQPSSENDANRPSCCSICLEDFDATSVIMTAGCSHSYHRPCILSWVKGHTDCPNCRADIYDAAEFAEQEGQQNAVVSPA